MLKYKNPILICLICFILKIPFSYSQGVSSCALFDDHDTQDTIKEYPLIDIESKVGSFHYLKFFYKYLDKNFTDDLFATPRPKVFDFDNFEKFNKYLSQFKMPRIDTYFDVDTFLLANIIIKKLIALTIGTDYRFSVEKLSAIYIQALGLAIKERTESSIWNRDLRQNHLPLLTYNIREMELLKALDFNLSVSRSDYLKERSKMLEDFNRFQLSLIKIKGIDL